ncbi:MAG: GMC oxidoreductase [Acidobacteriota bacterium]
MGVWPTKPDVIRSLHGASRPGQRYFKFVMGALQRLVKGGGPGTNPRFEVFGYPGLFVMDGSVVGANLGANPSLTITALAEYACAKFPAASEGR